MASAVWLWRLNALALILIIYAVNCNLVTTETDQWTQGGRGLPVVDLFAGAGGFGVGSRLAGADLRLSVEIDRWACETLRLNEAGNRPAIHEGSVIDLTGDALRQMAGLASSDPLIVVGGAPCQPFSKNAYWTDPGEDSRLRLAFYRGDEAAYQRPPSITEPRPDDRRDLLLEFARLTIEANADGFVLENVPSVFHPRNRKTTQVFIDTLKEAGMEVSIFKGNSAEFGVAQKRERIFISGTRSHAPKAPELTHAEEPSIFLKRYMGVGEAIGAYAGDEFFEPEEVVSGRWARSPYPRAPRLELQSPHSLGWPPQAHVRGGEPLLELPAEATPGKGILDLGSLTWSVGWSFPLEHTPAAHAGTGGNPGLS